MKMMLQQGLSDNLQVLATVTPGQRFRHTTLALTSLAFSRPRPNTTTASSTGQLLPVLVSQALRPKSTEHRRHTGPHMAISTHQLADSTATTAVGVLGRVRDNMC